MVDVDKPPVKYRVVKSMWADGTVIPPSLIITPGNFAVILHHPNRPQLLLKAPGYRLIEHDDGSWITDDVHNSMCLQEIEHELDAYDRLAGVEGVVGYHGLQLGCIAMDYHPLGSLQEHLLRTPKVPPVQLRLKWMSNAIRIVAACHKAHVLLFDIAMRNFIIADDYTLRAIDFSDSQVLPLDADLETAEHNGVTAILDIFHLGCVLYSLATWSCFENQRVWGGNWPAADFFPSVKDVPWGPLIHACWHRQFTRVEQVVKYCNSRRYRRRFKQQTKDQRVEGVRNPLAKQ